MRNSMQTLVERKLVPVGKSGNDIIYVCPHPNCDDKSGHLWINYHKGYFNCFKCGWGSKSLVPLLEKLGVDFKFDYESLERSTNESLDEILNMKKSTSKNLVDYSRNLKVLTAYYEQHSMPLSVKARQYLHDRGLSDMIIERLQIREGINRYKESILINGKTYDGRDYSGRVMVPSLRRDGTISYYVGRDITGTKKNKYLNPPKTLGFSSEDVWNLDNIETPYVIICEGVFSSIAVSNALGKFASCATYGKSISDRSNSDNPTISVTSQGEKLLNKNFSMYIVFYDKDAIVNALNTCKYLSDRGAKVRLVRIPENMYGPKADANDMRPEEIKELISNSEEYDRFTGLM